MNKLLQKGEITMGKRMIPNTNVQRNFKDTLFRMIFNEKDNLLNLYNAINHTHHDSSEEVQITTLENAIYMDMKNDVSFLFNFNLNLYEHQATYNPNMPLRDLFYISRQIESLFNKKSLYASKIIKIPTPKFVVFYNGTEEQPEHQILKLSSSFETPINEPELELKVMMININLGKSVELLENCNVLKEYMLYVEKVREKARTLPLEKAVELAVKESIQEGILEDFLRKHRREAINMSIFEYDQERELRLLRQAEREEGLEKGIEEGLEKGLEKGREEGRIQGTAELVRIIRKKIDKKLSIQEIADILEIDYNYVATVVSLIVKNLNLNDEEVAAKLIKDDTYSVRSTEVV